jgi:predicted transposase/invertase (TIGR01784 family)
MILGIDPKVDYAFKHLFGRESNQLILIDVLDSVLLPAPNEKIRELVILNPFNPKEALDDKLSILDIKARDQSGRQFNIEMQMLAYPAYDQRIVYYASKLHQQQFKEGQDYAELRPTISINFLNHVLFPDVTSHHLRFGLLEQAHHFALNDDLAFHILELPKFTKSAQELRDGLDIWLYFLRHAEKMDADALPAALEQPLVKKALEELKMLTQTDLERERYEARRKAQLDHDSMLNAALRQGREEGRKEVQEAVRRDKTALIKFFEKALNQPETPTEQLNSRSIEELSQMIEDLQTNFLKQRSIDA